MNSPDRRIKKKKHARIRKTSRKKRRPLSFRKITRSLGAVFYHKRYSAPLIIFLSLLWLYACPENTVNPVKGAVPGDWNPDFFWDCPWCTRYNKHLGIDIIKDEGTPVEAATDGMILYAGWLGKYGTAVVMISPKLRVQLYGHLRTFNNYLWPFVSRGTVIGAVGNTGTSDLPHLHYTVFSILPRVWLFEPRNMGWLKMFFLNPNDLLTHP